MKSILLFLFVSHISLCLGNEVFTTSNLGSKPGIQTWKIEIDNNNKYKVTWIPNNDLFQFNTQETYIILHSSFKIPRDGSSSSNNPTELSHTIYYWLGVGAPFKTVQNTAAYAMQLDYELRYKATKISRVVENKEPVSFASNFQHVFKAGTNRNNVKLYRIKGNEVANFVQMPRKPESLNRQDMFLLLSKNNMFIYDGGVRTDVENKTLQKFYSHLIETSRFGGSTRKLFIINDFSEFGNNITPFVKTLGASIQSLEKISRFTDYNPSEKPKAPTRPLSLKTEYPQATRGHTFASIFDEYRMETVRLYKFYIDASGKCNFRKLEMWPLGAEDLKSDSCYFFNTTSAAGVFVWLGKNASLYLRQCAVTNAEGSMEKLYPYSRPLTIIKEGQKNTSFDANITNKF